MANRGIGKYATLRPDKVEQFSSEFKRDLLDLNPALMDIHGKKSKKKKKSRGDSSNSSSSDSSSGSSDSEDSEEERRRRKKKRKSKEKDRDDKKKRRRRRKKSEDGDRDRERGSRDRRSSRRDSKDDKRRGSRSSRHRLVSGTSSDHQKRLLSKESNNYSSSDSSYKSPSNVENDSDLESDGLEMRREIEPLICYLREDRELFNKQIFKIIRGKRRKHLMPKVLRNINDKELKQTCLTELARWSNKRLRILMRTGKLLESEDEEAIAPLPKIEDSDDEMVDGDAKVPKVNGEAKINGDAKTNGDAKNLDSKNEDSKNEDSKNVDSKNEDSKNEKSAPKTEKVKRR